MGTRTRTWRRFQRGRLSSRDPGRPMVATRSAGAGVGVRYQGEYGTSTVRVRYESSTRPVASSDIGCRCSAGIRTCPLSPRTEPRSAGTNVVLRLSVGPSSRARATSVRCRQDDAPTTIVPHRPRSEVGSMTVRILRPSWSRLGQRWRTVRVTSTREIGPPGVER